MLSKVLKIRESLNISKSLLNKTFCGFRVLEHNLWGKHEHPEAELNKKLSWLTNKITKKLLKSNQFMKQ